MFAEPGATDELLAAATTYAESIVRPLQQGTGATVDEFFDAARISIVPTDSALLTLDKKLRQIARRVQPPP